jgi:hypothetical protein
LLQIYRFLSNRASTIPTIAIAATITPIPGSKYKSAAFAGEGVGGAVASGSGITVKPSFADDE